MILQFIPTLAETSCNSSQFFGLVPWYKYLPQVDFNGCNLIKFNVLNGGKSDVGYILLAVIDDMLRVAGVVAVGFIIYGAFQYTYSQGNPEQTSKAQSTIINALIGLTIAIIAVSFVSFIGSKLGG